MLETDIDIITEIEQVTWVDKSWSSKDFLHSLDDPFWTCWVLQETTNDHSILGYGIQYTLYNTSHKANLCIRPSQCGRGLGGILLLHLIGYARKNGASNVTLEVRRSNLRAYKFCVNHGFRTVGILPHYYSDHSGAYTMTLLL